MKKLMKFGLKVLKNFKLYKNCVFKKIIILVNNIMVYFFKKLFNGNLK